MRPGPPRWIWSIAQRNRRAWRKHCQRSVWAAQHSPAGLGRHGRRGFSSISRAGREMQLEGGEEGKSLPGMRLSGLLFDPCHGGFRIEKRPAKIGKSSPRRRCSDGHFLRIRSPSTMCGGMGSMAVNGGWMSLLVYLDVHTYISRYLFTRRVLQPQLPYLCVSPASGRCRKVSLQLLPAPIGVA